MISSDSIQEKLSLNESSEVNISQNKRKSHYLGILVGTMSILSICLLVVFGNVSNSKRVERNVGWNENRVYVTVNSTDEWLQVDSSVTDLIVESNCCNDKNLTVIDFSQFKYLKNVIIGDECFTYATEVIFKDLEDLEKVEIGIKGFTQWTQWNVFPIRSRDAHFICANNPKLVNLTLGRCSFNDFIECKIENLPSLETLIIGDIMKNSANFYFANFNLSNLPQLKAIPLGHGCFGFSAHTVFENLPKLEQIEMSDYVLYGDPDDETCSLVMRDLPSLTDLTSIYESFVFTHSVILENIPNVNHVKLPEAFTMVTSCTINNVADCLAKLVKVK